MSNPLDTAADHQAAEGDLMLMRRLGLKTTGFGEEWTELGTITERQLAGLLNHQSYAKDDPDWDDRVTIKVEVASVPARFWRFTVTRINDDVRQHHSGKPETFVITTGSDGTWGGDFRHYFQTARYIATNMMSVERVAS